VALAGPLAAIYALGVILWPASSGVPQVRMADALLPLSIIFGPPAVVGLTLGAIVANLSSGFGILDIGGGTLANFLATFIAWKIGRQHFHGSQFIATWVETVIITLVVGSYLQVFIQMLSMILSGIYVPGIVILYLGIFTGSLIAINIVGYAPMKGLQNRTSRVQR
jgi:hypothetical protein